jgi:uncharacterized protein (DUF2236 family)
VILSGDENGEPPWVKAIGEPGDAGWFGPGSATWQVNSSLATLIGGLRALLLQACHPLALAGVEQHSTYREDPLGRLQRTNRYVTTSTFGTTELADQAADVVRSVHQRVNGVAPDGRSYSAEDPRLLLWVHLGLTDSMLTAYRSYGGHEIDGDRYVEEMGRLAAALGVQSPPTSEIEMANAFASFRDEIAGGSDAESVARFLRFPGRALPIGAQLPYQLLARAATDLLPWWAHDVLRTPARNRLERNANAVACRVELAALQAVLGQRSRAVDLAHRRVSDVGQEPTT